MLTLVILIPILAFVTVLLLAFALAAPNDSTMHSRLRAYGYDLSRRPGGDLSQPFAQRILWPIAAKILRVAVRLTPAGVIQSSQVRLRQAHSSLGLGTFLLIRLIGTVAVPGLYFLSTLSNGSPGLRDWAIIAVLAYVGNKLPDMWLTSKIDSRKEQITRSLPDALDLIVVCVEAGYSLEASIQKVVETTTGPLAEEFSQTLAEVSLGRTRREALHDLSARCGSHDLQTFIAAILQADQMGVSIADALRVQSDTMRVRRRQRAEELIGKAPIKMLMPMLGLIFPALFVVLVGPAGARILSMFKAMSH